jgi:hypothetical protein
MSNPAVAQYNWHADWGLTLSRQFVWKDSNGNPINNTGYTATLTIRPDPSQPPVLVASGGQFVMGGATGSFTVTVVSSLMQIGDPSADAGYSYDIVVATGGVTVKLVEGPFTLHTTNSR